MEFTDRWALLYRDTFTLAFFCKSIEHAGTFCESIGTKYRVLEHHALVFCELLQYNY